VEELTNLIQAGSPDPEIDALLERLGDERGSFTRHFSEGESFFLELPADFTVPHFPIHHDVNKASPDPAYAGRLREVVGALAGLVPQVLKDLSYFFDPAQIHCPSFFKVYKVEDTLYLYLLRADLMARPAAAVAVIERGTNDTTPMYRSRRLFIEPVVIPLVDVVRTEGRISGFVVKQTLSQTWIGERGRGYFVQGIWMDMELSRLFSSLFLPAGRKTYPFFPFLCRYKTICRSVIRLDPDGRKDAVPSLHRAVAFLLPMMETIQTVFKTSKFSEEMELYKSLKPRIPPAWSEEWKDVRLQMYLNESGLREFRVED
jgi:hypothetical protein